MSNNKVNMELFNKLKEKWKEEVDLSQLLKSYNQNPAMIGSDLWIKCPSKLHNDEIASLSINEGKEIFHCFACKAKGDKLALAIFLEKWVNNKEYNKISYLEKVLKENAEFARYINSPTLMTISSNNKSTVTLSNEQRKEIKNGNSGKTVSEWMLYIKKNKGELSEADLLEIIDLNESEKKTILSLVKFFQGA